MNAPETTVITDVSTIDADGTVTVGRRVVLADGVIAAVEAEADAGNDRGPTAAAGAEMVDGRGCFLSPALVNLHTHTPMSIFKGIAEDVDADDWFNHEIWPYESVMDEADVALGVDLAIAESIQCGVSLLADHYFHASVVCAHVADAGLRLDMAPTLFGQAGDYTGQLDRAEDIVRAWHGYEGRIHIRLGPHAPYTCGPRELCETAERARELGVGVHIHMSETSEQVKASIAEHGKAPLEVAHEAGLLDVPILLAHGVFFTERELTLIEDILGTSGVTRSTNDRPLGLEASPRLAMVLCPKTYQKLGTGMGRVLDDLRRWPVAIGTDGAASSNTLNPIEQARLLGLWAKERTASGATLPARELWRIVMGAHRVPGFGTGRLDVGAPADLVLWDLDDPATQPNYDPVTTILYSSHPGNVRFLWVAGRVLKRDGAVDMDLPALFAEARRRVPRLVSRGKGRSRLVY